MSLLDLDPYLTSPGLQHLRLTRRLGCGTEGCVYATERGTVVKISDARPGNTELLVAKRLMALRDKHSIVPRVYAFGAVMFSPTEEATYVEREGLNDLQLSDEGEAQFTDEVGKVLGNASINPAPRIPSFVPYEDRQKLKALVRGHLWLKKHGVEPEDHNSSENWGVRADGTVALRDFGYVWVKPEES